jgi:hypothetical protein
MTTTLSNPHELVPAHTVTVVSDGHDYLAECCCGWASDWHLSPALADAAGADHVGDELGPPDEMDRLMSGLLDLQDDIAAVVIWLAENWSTDLPPLGWYGSGGGDWHPDQPALKVLAYCFASELSGAAAVLDAVPVDDPPNGAGRARYRRATREFGRVQIEVYTTLSEALAAETAP